MQAVRVCLWKVF